MLKCPWFSTPRSPRLLVISCRPNEKEAFTHTVYEGHKQIEMVCLSEILSDPAHIKGIRENPKHFIQWLLKGAL